MFWKSEGTNEHLAYRVNFSGENILKYFSYFPRKYENRIWHFMQFVPLIGFDISYKLFMQIVSLVRWYFMQNVKSYFLRKIWFVACWICP